MHGQRLAKDVQAAGVIWHGCAACGLPWPFPKGSTIDREWRCPTCANVAVARTRRMLESMVQRKDATADQLRQMALAALALT